MISRSSLLYGIRQADAMRSCAGSPPPLNHRPLRTRRGTAWRLECLTSLVAASVCAAGCVALFATTSPVSDLESIDRLEARRDASAAFCTCTGTHGIEVACDFNGTRRDQPGLAAPQSSRAASKPPARARSEACLHPRAGRLTIGRRFPTCPTFRRRLQRFSSLVVQRGQMGESSGDDRPSLRVAKIKVRRGRRPADPGILTP